MIHYLLILRFEVYDMFCKDYDSFISLLTILIVALSYGLIDPRVRIGGGKHDA